MFRKAKNFKKFRDNALIFAVLTSVLVYAVTTFALVCGGKQTANAVWKKNVTSSLSKRKYI